MYTRQNVTEEKTVQPQSVPDYIELYSSHAIRAIKRQTRVHQAMHKALKRALIIPQFNWSNQFQSFYKLFEIISNRVRLRFFFDVVHSESSIQMFFNKKGWYQDDNILNGWIKLNDVKERLLIKCFLSAWREMKRSPHPEYSSSFAFSTKFRNLKQWFA